MQLFDEALALLLEKDMAEFDAPGTVAASGKPYRYRYIVVITAKDGEIVEWRDCWNPLAAAELS